MHRRRLYNLGNCAHGLILGATIAVISLVIATKAVPSSFVSGLLPFLKPGSPFVVFSPFVQVRNAHPFAQVR